MDDLAPGRASRPVTLRAARAVGKCLGSRAAWLALEAVILTRRGASSAPSRFRLTAQQPVVVRSIAE